MWIKFRLPFLVRRERGLRSLFQRHLKPIGLVERMRRGTIEMDNSARWKSWPTATPSAPGDS